jgi:hypothetical protein
MMVQSADGRVHFLTGKDLPDSISLYSGLPYRGAHLAEVLLNPKGAKATSLLPNATGWLSRRDAFILLFGMFTFWLIHRLAEATALALL